MYQWKSLSKFFVWFIALLQGNCGFISSRPHRCQPVSRLSPDRRSVQFPASYVQFDAFIVVTSWCRLTLFCLCFCISISWSYLLLFRSVCFPLITFLLCFGDVWFVVFFPFVLVVFVWFCFSSSLFCASWCCACFYLLPSCSVCLPLDLFRLDLCLCVFSSNSMCVTFFKNHVWSC